MPIYEYRCTKGHTFDVMQRFSDEPLSKCEVCGSPANRVLHAPVVHLKGSGFYNTDYGTRKRSREMKESQDGASSDGAKTESSNSSSESSSSSDSGSNSSKSSESASSTKAKTAD